MPSLRQPVGPLPASIYWRRRIVVLAVLLALVGLVAWLTSGQGSGAQKPQQKTALPVPAKSITPGASPTGPANTGRAGGPPIPSPGPTLSGAASASPPAVGATDGSTPGGGAPGGSDAGAPPVNTGEVMALPACAASQVTLELAGAQNSYQPTDRPRLELTVHNASGGNCRVDLGKTASTITVTASTGERIWSSGDCPTDRQSAWVQLSAGSGLTETFTWDRTRSKPQCATADPTPAPPGTYLVQADLTGPSGGPVTARTSIRLES